MSGIGAWLTVPKARVSTSAINQYLQTIERLGGNVEEVAKKAVYEGTRIMADQVRANIQALPVDEHWGTSENPLHGVKAIQKQGLLDGFGVAEMRNDGGMINTLIGFDKSGYNKIGQPNLMIARATQSGTSFSDKIPFFDNAVRATRSAARAKMVEVAEQELENLTKG